MSSKKSCSILFLLVATCTQVGCLALNIPSERFHDTADGGGIFGPWRGGHLGHPTERPDGACTGEFHPETPCLFDGGPLEVDPFDPSFDENGAPKEEEIPWPRFHPVPTRPIFGANRF